MVIESFVLLLALFLADLSQAASLLLAASATSFFEDLHNPL